MAGSTPVPKLFELNEPDGSDEITAIPAFDVEAFARASEHRPGTTHTAAVPVSDSKEAPPAVEVVTGDDDLHAVNESEAETRLRVRRILGIKNKGSL
jgi:hypothetical protein